MCFPFLTIPIIHLATIFLILLRKKAKFSNMHKKIVSVLVILLCQQVKCTKILFDKIVRQNAQKGLVQVVQKMRQRFVHFAKSIGRLHKNFVRENRSSF